MAMISNAPVWKATNSPKPVSRSGPTRASRPISTNATATATPAALTRKRCRDDNPNASSAPGASAASYATTAARATLAHSPTSRNAAAESAARCQPAAIVETATTQA